MLRREVEIAVAHWVRGEVLMRSHANDSAVLLAYFFNPGVSIAGALDDFEVFRRDSCLQRLEKGSKRERKRS